MVKKNGEKYFNFGLFCVVELYLDVEYWEKW